MVPEASKKMVWKSISIDVLVKMYEMNPTPWGLFPEAHWVSEEVHERVLAEQVLEEPLVARIVRPERDAHGTGHSRPGRPDLKYGGIVVRNIP